MRFSIRSPPRNLALILIVITFLSISVLLLRGSGITENYFQAVEKQKERPPFAAHTDGAPQPGEASLTPEATSRPQTPQHVVEKLFAKGHQRYVELVSRQSKSLQEAEREYSRRYNRTVPDGFANWYKFATENGVQRIDEYDELDRWFEPFRRVGAQTLKDYIRKAMKGRDASPAICKIAVKNHQFEYVASNPDEGFWHQREFDTLLKPLAKYLPDLEILVNEWDEPRVLVGGDRNNEEGFEDWVRKSYKNSYDDFVTTPCKGRNASHFEDSYHPYLFDVAASKDVCRTPEVGHFYGMVQSPNALYVTHSPVPLLSMSKLSTVADLTYPNVLYIEGLLNDEYQEKHDIPWERKKRDLYWTGRTSGGLANKENNWHAYHRQRFVASVNGLPLSLSSPGGSSSSPSDGAIRTSKEFRKNPSLYNVRFVAHNQCDVDQCAEMDAYFNITGQLDSFDEIYKHQFLFDMDGNVFSRRFYSLMFSRSCVVKQTWQEEYFDSWLVPWKHYVPVSMDFTELPDLMRFLALTERGQQISAEIAEAGRNWALHNFRAVEGSSYMLRLLLEYASLFKEQE